MLFSFGKLKAPFTLNSPESEETLYETLLKLTSHVPDCIILDTVHELLLASYHQGQILENQIDQKRTQSRP